MSVDSLVAVADLAQTLHQAEHHLPRIHDALYIREPLHFIMFLQSWSDTSLGFGGMAGQAFTDSTVIVCWRQWGSHAVVFIGGRYAYPVHPDDPRETHFWNQLGQRVMGAYDWVRQCPHRLPANTNVCEFCGRPQVV